MVIQLQYRWVAMPLQPRLLLQTQRSLISNVDKQQALPHRLVQQQSLLQQHRRLLWADRTRFERWEQPSRPRHRQMPLGYMPMRQGCTLLSV